MNAISNRIAASSPRARFLGMVAGMAISQLVDKPDKAMKFNTEEMQTEEASWYLKLVYAKDELGTIDDIRGLALHKGAASQIRSDQGSMVGEQTTVKRKPKAISDVKPSKNGVSKVLIIEEIEDDDDLVPYAKADSDPEDEEDDPTLIQRNKPKAPV
jgi:telomere length regulation protein